MTHTPDVETQRLQTVAFEIRENMDAGAHDVSGALTRNRAFTRNRVPQSSLERSLLLQGAERGARLAKMEPENVGTGLDLHSLVQGVERLYRVKVVELLPDGSFKAIVSPTSNVLSEESGTLWPIQRWLIGVVVSADHTASTVMYARVVDHEGVNPVRLVLDDVTRLDSSWNPQGFIADDDDLGDFDEESGDGDPGV